jgi:hypothetical protein
MSVGERLLLAATALMILLFLLWILAREVVVMNWRLQAELARCQAAAKP